MGNTRGLTVLAGAIAGALLVLQLAHVLSGWTASWIALPLFFGGGIAWEWYRRRQQLEQNSLTSSGWPDWLDIEDEVVEFVQRRSNVLYVWADVVGGGFGVLRCSTDRPAGQDFNEVTRSPFRLRIATDIDPLELRIRYRSWPRERLRIDGGEGAGDGGGG